MSPKERVQLTSECPDFLPSSSDELSSVNDDEEPPSDRSSTSMEEPVSDILAILNIEIRVREVAAGDWLRTVHWGHELSAKSPASLHTPEHDNVWNQPTYLLFDPLSQWAFSYGQAAEVEVGH